MTEQENLSKKLTKVTRQDISPFPHNEPLDLDTARLVLETVVGIHENTLTETSDLTKAGKYDIGYVREALNSVSQNILNTHQKEVIGSISWAEKRTSNGIVSLNVKSENISLELISGGNYVLESEVPLRPSDFWFSQESVGFSDFRNGINVTWYDIKHDFSLDKYKQIWRGMRWLVANMLNWDGEFKLPEDLDQSVLPKTTS